MGNEFKIALYIDGSNVTAVSIGNTQHQGMREYQEDSFGYTNLNQSNIQETGFAAIVSDGMGGLSSGDEVSRYSVSALSEAIERFDRSAPADVYFRNVFNDINNAVTSGGTGGGATLSAVYCTQKGVFWGSTGDSRIYFCRRNKLYQLSRDFDYMDMLLDRVIDFDMTMDEALSDPKKDNLAAYIGSGEYITPDTALKPLLPYAGDRILICSDGVYNALSETELISCFRGGAQNSADMIGQAVLNKGYRNQDNFTAIVLEFK